MLEGQLFKLFSAVSVQNEEARLMSELFSLLLHQLLHSYLPPHGGQWPWWSSSPSTPCLSCTVSPPTLCDWTRRPLLLRFLWLDRQQNLWGGETYKPKLVNDIKTYAAKQRKIWSCSSWNSGAQVKAWEDNGQRLHRCCIDSSTMELQTSKRKM